MAISFDAVPTTRVPFVYIEFDSSFAQQGPSVLQYRVLMIGSSTDAGSKAAKVIDLVTSVSQAESFYGAGSQLHRMFKKYFQNNNINETRAISAQVDVVAVATGKATGKVTLAGTATAAGSVKAYIGGERVVVNVAVGDTAATVITNLKAEIDANHTDLAVKSTALVADLNLECLTVGEEGDRLDLRWNFFDGEETPAGLTDSFTAMSGGGANPDISSGSPSVIDVLGDDWYQIWCVAFTDSANLVTVDVELERRFGPTTQIDGVSLHFLDDTQANLVTKGAATNSKQFSIMGMKGVPTWGPEVAAAAAGQVGASLIAGNGAEARPFQTLPLKGVLAPKVEDRFTFSENDILLKNGIATLQVRSDGTVAIQRMIMNYQKDSFGSPDTAFLDANTRFTLMFLRFDFRNTILGKFPRSKLADDGTKIGPGQAVITPKVGRGEAISKFREWEELGLVEGFDQFKNDLIVERNSGDPNRLDFFLPPDLVNQFRVGGVKLAFLL